MTMIETFDIAGYARISVDDEQDQKNISIENQKAIIEDYVKTHFPGSTLTFFEDRDRSGYTFEQREGYQEMRRGLMSHKYDILIIKDFSRFSRRNSRGLVELEDLRDAGVRIISIGDGVDFPNDDDWLKIQFQFLVNEMPVTDTSRKVRNVIKRRQDDGEWICAAPYGYLVTEDKQFELIPTEAETVRKIFDLYNNAGWGYKKIANYLTDQGVPTPRMSERMRKEAAGKKTKREAKNAWAIATVQGILDNDFYIGTLRQGKYTRAKINGKEIKRNDDEHIVIENHHQAIIDYRTFAITISSQLSGSMNSALTARDLALEADPDKKIAVFEEGQPLEKRRCPIDGKTVKHCVGCPTCAIMNGFGGAGAFSDGKYNLTNEFGGTLYEYIGKQKAMELMHYVDEINVSHGGENTKLYSTANSAFKTRCLQCNLHLLDASVRHLGTDINFVVLKNLFAELAPKVDFYFRTPVRQVLATDGGYEIVTDNGSFSCKQCIVSVGRSGSKWMESVCRELNIETKSNRVDIGVRVELPAEIFKHLTDELYESKIVYKTEKYQDLVRTFCMNPKGAVVTENTNGIVTVNGHSYEDPAKQTENTNFALLVSKHFTEPFKDSNGYGESIARLSNMLGGGVMVQRFGDLIRGQRSTQKRIDKSFVTPTLTATPGDLSLVIPKRILDGIIEMIYALDKIAPGTANDDTLLYGVEVKFYNMEVSVDENLETAHKGLFIIGDGSGITHSLSHASASGVYVARHLAAQSTEAPTAP